MEINFINIFKTYILIYIINCPKVFVGFFLSKRSPETAANKQSSTNKQLTSTILCVMVKVKATISYIFRKVVHVRVRNDHPNIFHSRYNCTWMNVRLHVNKTKSQSILSAVMDIKQRLVHPRF